MRDTAKYGPFQNHDAMFAWLIEQEWLPRQSKPYSETLLPQTRVTRPHDGARGTVYPHWFTNRYGRRHLYFELGA